MKKRSAKRNEFYVYKVVRDGVLENDSKQTQEDVKEEKSYVISPHYGRQEIRSKFENMGYHRDPKTYDVIRPDRKLREDTISKHQETYKKQTVNKEPEYYVDQYDIEYFEEENSNTIDDVPEDVFSHDYHGNIRKFSGQPGSKVVKQPKPSFDEVIQEPTFEVPRQEVKKSPVVNVGPKPSKYTPPRLDFLSHTTDANNENVQEAERQKTIINKTLQESGIRASVSDYIFCPTVTQFLLKLNQV